MTLSRWFAVSAVVVLVATACTGGIATRPATPRAAVSRTDLPSIRKEPFRQPPAPPVPGARYGGTLHVLGPFGMASLDPSETYYTDTIEVESDFLIRSLTQYVYDRRTGSMVLIPDLATDLGRPGPHFRSWSFTIRRGVRYENGRQVTPQDVAFGIERSFDRTTFPAGASYSNKYFLDGGSYRGPYLTRAPYRGVSISGRTITIRMAKPFPDMPYWASYPAMSPIPRGSVSDPMTYKLHPLATGPYRIAHYVPDKALVLVRNVMWDPGTDPGRHQYVNRVVMDLQIPPEKIDATILADKGIGRTAVSESNVVAADYRAFSIRAPGRLIRSAMTCTYAWWPDNRKIDDVRIRRALAWAFPYRAAWRVSGEIPGVTRFPATNIQPPGTSGRVNYNPLPDHVPASTDPQRARALLQASAHLGYRLSWPYFSDLPESVALKAVLVSAFRAAGFDPKPYPMKYVDYTAQVMRNPAAPVNLRSMGWCGDWPTGLTWFPELFASNRIPNHGSGENLAFFSKPDVDRQIQQIIQLPLSRQPAAWNALDRLIQTRYFPMVVTGYGGVALMRGSLVHGAFADFVTGMPTFKDIWLGEAINDVTPWRTAD